MSVHIFKKKTYREDRHKTKNLECHGIEISIVMHPCFVYICVRSVCVCVCSHGSPQFSAWERGIRGKPGRRQDRPVGERGTRGQRLLWRKRGHILLTVVLLLVLLLACISILCPWKCVSGLWGDKVAEKVPLQLSWVSMSGAISLCPSHWVMSVPVCLG